MKIKALICAFLCTLLIGMTAFATQSTEENAADNNTQQAEMQPPQEGQMPSDENMPQSGELGGRGFGGRGGPGGGRGMRPDMPMNGESMQPPAEETQTQTDSSIPAENAGNTHAESFPSGNGEIPEGGFGGRGGFGGESMGGNMQMPGQQMQEDASAAATTTKPNYFTHISAAVLLVLGFLFVIFYKRRTF